MGKILIAIRPLNYSPFLAWLRYFDLYLRIRGLSNLRTFVELNGFIQVLKLTVAHLVREKSANVGIFVIAKTVVLIKTTYKSQMFERNSVHKIWFQNFKILKKKILKTLKSNKPNSDRNPTLLNKSVKRKRISLAFK